MRTPPTTDPAAERAPDTAPARTTITLQVADATLARWRPTLSAHSQDTAQESDAELVARLATTGAEQIAKDLAIARASASHPVGVPHAELRGAGLLRGERWAG